MKKLFIALLTSSLALTSCTLNNNNGGTDVLYVYLLTSVNSTNETGVKTGLKLEYSDTYADAPNTTFKFTTYPVLKLQTILPQNQETIKYTYKDNKKLIIEKSGKGVVKTDSMLFNNMAMVNEIFVDNKAVPFNIQYNSNGYRTNIGADTTFTVMDGNYLSMMSGGKIVREYSYSQYPNIIGLQQFGIVGEPLYANSERFGKQSKLLLEKVIVQEKGEMVEYTFSYMFDGNGLVLEETVKKDSKNILVNKYTYQMGVVEVK